MDGRFGSGRATRVSLACRDGVASARFYGALFGVPLVKLDGGGWRTEALGGMELVQCPPEYAPSGVSGYEFGVEDPAAALARLKERGYVCLDRSPNVFRDPDGRQIRVVAARMEEGV